MSQEKGSQVGLEYDADGSLFDARVRIAMTQFTGGHDTLTFEAAAAVRTAFQAIERLRARGAEGRGLSSGALDLLIRLSAAPEADDGVSLGALAQAAGVSARTVTGLMDTLQQAGLVERLPDRHDRRAVLARITPAGHAWLGSFRRPAQVAMAAIFRGFTPAELTRLRHLCLRLVDNQRHIQQHRPTPTPSPEPEPERGSSR